MKKTNQDASLHHQRAEFYLLLSECYKEPTQELADDLLGGELFKRLEEYSESLSFQFETTEDLERYPATPVLGLADKETVRKDLGREYTRLFIGWGRPVVPPYEAMYLEDVPIFEKGLVAGRSTVEVLSLYKQMGVEISEEFTELPDHISVELEFMSLLAAAQAAAINAGKTEDARSYQSAQEEFLSAHLMTWIPKLCERLITSSEMAFYKLVARITQSFLLKECERFEAKQAGLCTA